MSGMRADARFLSRQPASSFLESKTGLGGISLPKENYENSNLNLPLLDRPSLDGLGPNPDTRPFSLSSGNRRRLGQRWREHLARGERDAG